MLRQFYFTNALINEFPNYVRFLQMYIHANTRVKYTSNNEFYEIEKILIFLDNFSGHKVEKYENIKISALVLQLLDHGILYALRLNTEAGKLTLT